MTYVSIHPQHYRLMLSAMDLLREGVSVEMVGTYLQAMTSPLSKAVTR